jgi:hypothetical protein
MHNQRLAVQEKLEAINKLIEQKSEFGVQNSKCQVLHG